jgi:heptosyltransferase-2
MKPLDKQNIRKLLIRCTNWLGDAVMTTPAIRAVRETFPAAELTLLANPLVSQLFSAQISVDRVLVYDRNGIHAGLAGKLRMAKELRAQRFDLAILLQNAFDAALVTWLAGIPRRLGKNSDGRGLLLTHPYPLRFETVGAHQVDSYLAMLESFGIAGADRRISLATTDAEDSRLAALLAEAGIGPTDFLLGINPGATYGAAKRWYPERFAIVAQKLAANWQARIVITGGPGEAAIAREIEDGLAGGCLNLAGKTSVRELMALIKRCNFFITNDSGPMHIAAAFGVPLVAIFGSTDHLTTAPFSSRAAIVRQETDCAPCLKRECPTDHRCMTAVTVDDVVTAAVELCNATPKGMKR